MKTLTDINNEIADTNTAISKMSDRVQSAKTRFEEELYFNQMLQLLQKRNALRWVTE